MKIKGFLPFIVVFLLIGFVSNDSFAQSNKNNKKNNTSQDNTTRKVVVPSPGKNTPESPNAPVPPGREGKVEKNDNQRGYERTGNTGRKEGWDQNTPTTPEQKKAIQKNNKQRSKEMKKAQKERSKAMKKNKKHRAPSAPASKKVIVN